MKKIQKYLLVVFVSLLGVAFTIDPARPQSQLEEAKKEVSLAFYTSLTIAEAKPQLHEFVKRCSYIKGDLVRLGGTSLITHV